MNNPQNEWLVVKEVAKLADLTEVAIRKAIQQRRLNAHFIGRQWLIHKSEAERFAYER